MNKSFLKVSALTAGLSAVSGVVMADNMGLTVGGQVGMGGLLGSDGLVKFAEKEKIGEAELSAEEARVRNAFISEPAAGKNLVWDAGFRFSYDFGADNDEMFGVEIGAKFFMNKHTATFKDANDDAARAKELATGVSLSGISVDLSGRIIPVHFDGGFMVITLGVDSKFNIVGKDFITDKRGNVEMFAGTDAEKAQAKDKVKDAIAGMNFAGKFGVGANFVDEMIHVSLNARYWLMDQVDRTNAELVKVDAGLSRLSVGNGLDATLSIGFNMMPLFS